MKNQELTQQESNILIAEFMGLKKSNRLYEKSFTYVGDDIIKAGLPFKNGIMGNCMDDLPFHNSWDWLMPVAEKIHSTYKASIEIHGSSVKAGYDYETHIEAGGSMIQNTYQAVVKFIQWYNDQKANPMEEQVKVWYCKTYPTDDLGPEIQETLTFEQLDSDVTNVYNKLGVTDSIVRERCFERIAKITNTSYQEVYDRWIED
jgi:hypothetical protein